LIKSVIERFLDDEIQFQELYEDIFNFITSFHIRNGEFEGNYFIIKKMDHDNFFIFPEHIYPDNHREIPFSDSIYRKDLIAKINEHAAKQGLKTISSD
jgi:hypothetical protein